VALGDGEYLTRATNSSQLSLGMDLWYAQVSRLATAIQVYEEDNYKHYLGAEETADGVSGSHSLRYSPCC